MLGLAAHMTMTQDQHLWHARLKWSASMAMPPFFSHLCASMNSKQKEPLRAREPGVPSFSGLKLCKPIQISDDNRTDNIRRHWRYRQKLDWRIRRSGECNTPDPQDRFAKSW